ncbi:MAG: EAL domain-containing protein [Spirulinaceae cyanobacterium SM2_1_0]|nr:EAL domain-containing protein [Spirulinaceae cyanobacterium SM2_1_0]
MYILVVDDKPQNLRLLADLLSAEGYSVRKSLNGSMAITAAQASPPDLILLDIMMPEMDGYEVCRQLKAAAATATIPVIFLSALDEAFDKVRAFQVGAADYVTKPFQVEEVLVRIKNQLALRAAQQQIQQLNADLEARVQERTHQLEQAMLDLRQEAAERQLVQAQLLDLALHDPLTGLPNRAYLLDRLAQSLDDLAATADHSFALLFLDCDRFKLINDSLGYSLGDALLQAIAERLQQLAQPQDTLVRLGGDEFALLLAVCEEPSQPMQVARQIQQLLSAPFCLRQREVFVSVSIGIVFGERSYEQPEHLLRDADTAMHRAKARQRGSYHIFDPALYLATLHALQLETDLRHALQRRELELHYQPIVDLASGNLFGVEALVRWSHPTRGFIPPDRFIPVAEETGLIIELGAWVLETACQQAYDWQRAGLVAADFTLGVNISVHQFAHPQFLQQIDQVLAETGFSSTCLKLEMTESAIMDNTQQAAATMQALRDRQIRLSIDDFGTGYSSLSYLHLFPVDTLKIDRTFIQHLSEAEKTLNLVAAILGMAKALGIVAIAEGIETAEQAQLLRQLDCNLGQGYWFARPLTATAFAEHCCQSAEESAAG